MFRTARWPGAALLCWLAVAPTGYAAAAAFEPSGHVLPEAAGAGAVGTAVRAGPAQQPSVQFTPFPIERSQAERVWGDGFDPDVGCEILVNLEVPAGATCEVSGDGQVTGSFRAPPTGDTVSVRVCQSDPSEEVDDGDPCDLRLAGSDEFHLVNPRPELTLTPARVQPGDSVQVAGLGFLPDGVSVTAAGVSVEADSQPWGSFRTRLTIPRDTQPGPFEIQGCSGPYCADSTIVVEPPAAPTAEPSSPTAEPSTPTGGPSAGTDSTPDPGTPSAAQPTAAATTAAPGVGLPPTPSSGSTPSTATGTADPPGRGGSSGLGAPPAGPAAASRTLGWLVLVLLVVLAVVLARLAASALHPDRRARRWTRRHLTLASRPGGASVVSLDLPGAPALPAIRLVSRPDTRPDARPHARPDARPHAGPDGGPPRKGRGQ